MLAMLGKNRFGMLMYNSTLRFLSCFALHCASV